MRSSKIVVLRIIITAKTITSRERPKSASYLGLNNIQGITQPIVKISIYHTVPKNPERVFPETRKQFFKHWKHQKKTNLPLRKIKIFQKVFCKNKSHNAEKPKKRPFRLIKRFLQTDNFKEIQGGTL